MSDTIKIRSSSGDEFEIPKVSAEESEFLKQHAQEDGDDDEPEPVDIPNVESAILAKVAEFFRLNATSPLPRIPKPLPWGKDLKESVPENFIAIVADMDVDSLVAMMIAGDFMQCPKIVSLAAAKIGYQINQIPWNEAEQGVYDMFKISKADVEAAKKAMAEEKAAKAAEDGAAAGAGAGEAKE